MPFRAQGRVSGHQLESTTHGLLMQTPPVPKPATANRDAPRSGERGSLIWHAPVPNMATHRARLSEGP
eukprot:6322453-Prymnesium_polylepis.1